MQKTKLVISCFYGAVPPLLPVGFEWANILSTDFKDKYKITLLFHGQCIHYGLKENNNYAVFLNNLVKYQKVKIVICGVCLKNDGYSKKDLLPFIKIISFSIDYIAESQKKGAIVIYDAKQS